MEFFSMLTKNKLGAWIMKALKYRIWLTYHSIWKPQKWTKIVASRIIAPKMRKLSPPIAWLTSGYTAPIIIFEIQFARAVIEHACDLKMHVVQDVNLLNQSYLWAAKNNSDVINGGIGPTPNWKNITKIRTKITVVIEKVALELFLLKWIRHAMMTELSNIPTVTMLEKIRELVEYSARRTLVQKWKTPGKA